MPYAQVKELLVRVTAQLAGTMGWILLAQGEICFP